MIEELLREEIVKKVGGRFKLSTLIQKRLVQLTAGARPAQRGSWRTTRVGSQQSVTRPVNDGSRTTSAYRGPSAFRGSVGARLSALHGPTWDEMHDRRSRDRYRRNRGDRGL